MNRAEQISRAKISSLNQETPVVLKIDTGKNREIFFYEKGLLQKYSLERYKGNRVRLSDDEWQASQEFTNEV